MERDVVEQAHEIYFNVIVAHGGSDAPWTAEQRTELRRALSLLEPLESTGDLGPDGLQLMASLFLELGNDEREEHVLRDGLDQFPTDAGLHADLGTAYAKLDRWPLAVAHLAATFMLGIDESDEQRAVLASQLLDVLEECGDDDRAETVRRFALSLINDEKSRELLEGRDDEAGDDADADGEGGSDA
ncbi:MAG: hypothetical protein PVSMB8_15750 [Vulcanimicrobiaceae bacterium]